MTYDEAIAMAHSKWWIGMDARDIAEFQLQEKRLCMDFSDFHKAVEHALQRDVYTHEFADPDSLLQELRGEKPPRSIIVNLMPVEKRVVIMYKDEA